MEFIMGNAFVNDASLGWCVITSVVAFFIVKSAEKNPDNQILDRLAGPVAKLGILASVYPGLWLIFLNIYMLYQFFMSAIYAISQLFG